MPRKANVDNPHAKAESEYRKLEGHYKALEAMLDPVDGIQGTTVPVSLPRDMAARVLKHCETHANVPNLYQVAPRWAGRIAELHYRDARQKAEAAKAEAEKAKPNG